MKLIALMSLFLGFVSAAQVPSFSANDDYDEVNLNIRMLQNTTARVTVSGVVTVTMTVPTGSTPESLNADTAFTGALCSSLIAAGGLSADDECTITAVEAAERRARALQDSLDLSISYTLVISSAAAADAFSAAVASGSAAAFEAALTAALATALAAIDTNYAVSAITSAGASVVTTTAAPVDSAATTGTDATTAAAAASPADSSDASMIKANVALAAVAALVASVFA